MPMGSLGTMVQSEQNRKSDTLQWCSNSNLSDNALQRPKAAPFENRWNARSLQRSGNMWKQQNCGRRANGDGQVVPDCAHVLLNSQGCN